MKLYNDNCISVMQLMKDNSIDLILTDPPYGVNFANDFYNDKYNHVINEMQSWFKEWFRLLKENCYLYVFTGVKTLHNWIQAGIDAGFKYNNIIATSTYHSNKLHLHNNFNYQFQPIILFSKGKGKKLNSVCFIPTSESWLNDKRNKNPKPFTYDYPNFINPKVCFSTTKSERLHPNAKNPKLLQFFIEISTNENDVVLDSFMGSGSTGIACQNCNREFIGIELDKNYFELTKKRLTNLYFT